MVSVVRPNTIEDVWRRVDRRAPDECWEWTGLITTWGYGTLTIRYRHWQAHRAAWVATHGEIPEGLCVLHRCDNRKCCNPSHLFLGTLDDNNKDMKAKGRARGRRGVKNAGAKLTEDQVREIRRRYAAGNVSQQALGAEYGISQSVLGKVVRGITYRDVA